LGIVQGQILLTGWEYINLYRYRLIGPANLRIELWASVVLALPVAFMLLKLHPEKRWLYLLLAVVPGLVWLNLDLVGGPLHPQFAGSINLNWLPELYALPAAASLIRRYAPKMLGQDRLNAERGEMDPTATTPQRDPE
jgi:hypothetical protein